MGEGNRELIRYACLLGVRQCDGPEPASAAGYLPKSRHATMSLFVRVASRTVPARHTGYPEAYWREALGRDPGDARCNHAMGRWHLRRGEFAPAEGFLRRSIRRLTLRNPNPYDGDVYCLGLTLRFLARYDEGVRGILQVHMERRRAGGRIFCDRGDRYGARRFRERFKSPSFDAALQCRPLKRPRSSGRCLA